MNFDFLKNIGSGIKNFGGNAMSKIKIGNNPAALSTSPITAAIEGNYGSGSPIIDAIQGNGENALPAAINNYAGGMELPGPIGDGKKLSFSMGGDDSQQQQQAPIQPIPYSPQMQAFNPANFQAQYNYMPQQGRNLEEMYRQMRGY
jgi:hypothetical protein